MALLESTLTLLVVAIAMLQISRRWSVPYPTVLALAGAGVAALPWAPSIAIEPHLALALFVAPALLDAAYDLPPRELRRNWAVLTALAVVAVALTTAAVAWAGAALAGLPIFAAIALGAIVAPPDAVAATAVLQQFDLPRRVVSVLQGESLLNDAVALLIYSAAVSVAAASETEPVSLAMLVVAAPGGILLGILAGQLMLLVFMRTVGTLSATLLQFVAVFGVWVIAERLHVSAILAIVAFAMWIAREGPYRQPARDRVHSYAVWEAVVFLVNVLAFLLTGLQARTIVERLEGPELLRALAFAGLVLVIVIAVRAAWVFAYGLLFDRMRPLVGGAAQPKVNAAERILVAWCGMRGLVTLAAALALPENFPERDLIVLSAFTVVLGTLALQGLTVGPLVRMLKIEPDRSSHQEIAFARKKMIEAAIADLDGCAGAAADAVRTEYRAASRQARDIDNPQAETEYDRLRMQAIAVQRGTIATLRRNERISDDTYHRLEEELDFAELSASPPDRVRLVEG